MKRQPPLRKFVFRASAAVRTWLDEQAHELMRPRVDGGLGIRTLTEARGLVLTKLAGASGRYVEGVQTFREERGQA